LEIEFGTRADIQNQGDAVEHAMCHLAEVQAFGKKLADLPIEF
jgi:hypothetical protein